MARVFIFHGTGGHPGENWFPWLQDKLKEKGVETIIPQFPTPEGQSLEAWLEVLKEYETQIDANTILIGHSLGCIFLLRLLERRNEPIKAAIFVAAPIGVKPIKNWDGDSAFSGGFQFDWDRIRANAGRFIAYHSDDDPYVGLGNGQELARQLGVELTFIPNSGHFNASAGYTKFDKLFENVEAILNQD